jgi:lipoprotein-anchoring transpeptidase ErfK/SrfK
MIRISFSAGKPVAIALSLALSACASSNDRGSAAMRRVADERAERQPSLGVGNDPVQMYGDKTDAGFRIPGLDARRMNPEFVRQVVNYQTNEAPGTIVVNQKARFLYLVQPGGKAIRYAVAVGPDARAFDGGEAVIARKAEWPRWIPTPDMVKRNPAHYGPHKDGVDGGPANPMGARALYMHKDGKDTYYRVHGTNDPSSIGKAVSAGCIRLLNQDIIDLYNRVAPGARIVVQG